MRIIALSLTAVVALTACEPTSLRDPNNPNRNTQQGALIGAATGALIGIARGDNAKERQRGAIIGAALGAGGGALVGNQLDKQEAELRAQMGNDVRITNTGDQLVVSLPQDILFATGSAQLTSSQQANLTALASSLNRYPNTTVNVIGHTDNVGDASYNQGLSQRRAQAVSGVLIGAGVAPRRINAIGRGEDQPIASNYTPDGRAQNRRVDVVITPTG